MIYIYKLHGLKLLSLLVWKFFSIFIIINFFWILSKIINLLSLFFKPLFLKVRKILKPSILKIEDDFYYTNFDSITETALDTRDNLSVTNFCRKPLKYNIRLKDITLEGFQNLLKYVCIIDFNLFSFIPHSTLQMWFFLPNYTTC